LGTAGHHKQAVEVLDNALARLFEYEVPEEKLNHIVHHIEGQKLEAKANIADFHSSSTNPESLLSEAESHYATIDLTRSKERVHRKLQDAKRRAPTADTETPTDDTDQAVSSRVESRAAPASASGKSGSSEPQPRRRSGEHVRAGHAQSTSEQNPALDDFLTSPDHSKTGSADLMTSPDDRDSDPSVGYSPDYNPDE
jgi:hypothetical protein